MRLIAAFAASLLAQASFAFSQTADEVKGDILAALSTPLPITVIGPIITRDVKVAADGAGFVATLEEPMLMGIVPLKSMSFKLTPQGDKLYRITDFKLPSKLNVLNMVDVGIGETKFDGVWSATTRSYQTLGFQLKAVDVSPVGGNGSKVTIGALALDVAKEGEAGATESKFSLAASDVTAKGFPPNTVNVKSVVAELKADGEKPVDLYSVLSRFVVLGAMQADGNALLQFAESLRAEKYDSLVLNVAAKGVDVKGSEPGSTARLAIADVSAVAGLKSVTPEEWGQFTFAIDGTKIQDRGILGLADMNADSSSFVIDGTRIPIGATLNAITTLQAISRGEAGVVRVADILDGLLNMGGIKITSNAKGIAYLPDNKDDPTVRVGSYSFESGTEGFRDNKGRLFFKTTVDDVNLDIKKFNSETEQKAYQLFNPKVIRYDLTVSDLNEQLLRKLMADIEITSEQDAAALAVPAVTYAMALKPIIETADMRFQSAEVEMTTSGKLRFYPAWILGSLPYEGDQKLSVRGLDKIGTFVADLKAAGATDRTGMSVLQSVMSTFKALSVAEGDTLNWRITYPKAGEGLMLVNDTELRFPDLTASLAPMLMTFGIGSAFNYVPPTVDQAPVVEAPAEETQVDEAVPAPMAEETAPATEEAVPAQ